MSKTRHTHETLTNNEFYSKINIQTRRSRLTPGLILWSYKLGKYIRLKYITKAIDPITKKVTITEICYQELHNLTVNELGVRFAKLDPLERFISPEYAIRCYEEDETKFNLS